MASIRRVRKEEGKACEAEFCSKLAVEEFDNRERGKFCLCREHSITFLDKCIEIEPDNGGWKILRAMIMAS